MAFTPMSGKTTGDVLTAAEFNRIVDNFDETGVAKVTTKGDLTPATGSKAVARLAAGAKGTYLVPASGAATGLKWQTPHSAILIRGANKSIANASLTLVDFDATGGPGSTPTEVHDPSNMHNNSSNNTRIVVPEDGVYLIGGFGYFAANTGGDQRYIAVCVEGTEYVIQGFTGTPGNAVVRLAISVPTIVLAGQRVELKVFQNCGSALNLTQAGLWVVWQNNFGL